MTILAVDYGTTYTTAALARDGKPELLALGGSEANVYRLPSTVWVDETGELVVGWQAERGAALAPERLERAPKGWLGDREPMQLGRAVFAEEAAAAVLSIVVSEAKRSAGALTEIRLTHPASWPNRRKAALRAAAREAGLELVELVEEPVAAARHLAGADVATGDSVAVYDLGGGTFDTAVLRATELGDFEVIGVGGRDGLGGEVFDARLARHLTSELRQSSPGDQKAIERSGRALAGFRREVRRAKEALSLEGAYDVVLPEVTERPSLRVTREELERLIDDQVRESVDILAETIAAAGIEPKELRAFYLAGGSSRMPLVARLLSERFGRVPDTREDPKSVVSLGAAQAVQAPKPQNHPIGGRPPVPPQPLSASGHKEPPPPQKPVCLTAPTINGTPRVGQTLTCCPGEWQGTGEETRWSMVWIADQGGMRTVAAEGMSLIVTDALADARVSCEVMAEEGGVGEVGRTSPSVIQRRRRLNGVWAGVVSLLFALLVGTALVGVIRSGESDPGERSVGRSGAPALTQSDSKRGKPEAAPAYRGTYQECSEDPETTAEQCASLPGGRAYRGTYGECKANPDTSDKQCKALRRKSPKRGNSTYAGTYDECIADSKITSEQCQVLRGGKTYHTTLEQCSSSADTTPAECAWLPGGKKYPGSYDDCIADSDTIYDQCQALRKE